MTKPNGEWWVGQVDLDRASVVLHLSRSFELSKAASHEDRTLAVRTWGLYLSSATCPSGSGQRAGLGSYGIVI